MEGEAPDRGSSKTPIDVPTSSSNNRRSKSPESSFGKALQFSTPASFGSSLASQSNLTNLLLSKSPEQKRVVKRIVQEVCR